MQTNFTLAQLADPKIEAAEKILRSCVHCGFCTATCPTYVQLGDELDSPRGRIYLIKDMLENDKPAHDEVTLHIDRCLSCLSCMTTCPSGVDYKHLVDHARAHIHKTYKRPLIDRLTRTLLARIMPYPKRFRAAMAGAFFAKPFAGLVALVPGLSRIAAILRLTPSRMQPRSINENKHLLAAHGKKRGRVALLRGCVQSVIDPAINDAAIRILTRSGIDVVMPESEGCCGGLVLHMGQEEEAHEQAKRNVDAWIDEMEKGGLDAILTTTSGCGTTIKDYGSLLGLDPDYADKAARVSSLAKDISEYIEELDLGEPKNPSGLNVAYHAACSLQHGQQIVAGPKSLLTRAGFKVSEPGEGHLCCGSAGTYNLLQPEIAEGLRDRKVTNIEATGADLIAAGNLGCIIQIGNGTDLPIVHTVELLDWAYGGPKPAHLDQV
jgi:glycolate oxidase iron-sulfur subunit